jgi:hypothetical protein
MNIYCRSCGSKHPIGSKFCSSCGASLSGDVVVAQKQSRPNPQKVQEDEDGIPESVVIPSRLSYTIEKPRSNKFTVAEALASPPSEPDRLGRDNRVANYQKMSQKDFIAQSMKECGSSAPTEINE